MDERHRDGALVDLAGAVDELHVPTDGPVMADLVGLHASLEARVVGELVAWDATGLWGPTGDGARSLACWVADHAQVSKRAAVRLVGLARLCARAPVTLAAWVDGRLSSAQVEAIAAAVPQGLRALWADHEDAVVPTLRGLDEAHTRAAMRHWADRARAETGTEPRDRTNDRSCYLDATLDETAQLRANLTGEAHAAIAAALRLAEGTPDGGDARTAAQRRHDALVEVALSYLDRTTTGHHSHHRAHVNVVVERSVLTTGHGCGTDLGSGATLTAEEVRRIACDAAIHRVYRSGSTVVDYGRSTRTIPAPLFTAVSIRDGGCRFPGCSRSAGESRGHHVQFWEDGGPTDQANVVLLCNLHHWVVHHTHWSVELDPDDATCTWTDGRTGRTRRSRPHPRAGGGPDQPGPFAP